MLKFTMAMMATTAFVCASADSKPKGTFKRMHRMHMERLHAERIHDRLHDEMRERMLQRRPSIRALDEYRRDTGDFEEDSRGRPVMEAELPGVDGRYADGSWGASGAGYQRMRPATRMDDVRAPGDASRAMLQDLRDCQAEVSRLQGLNDRLSQQLMDNGIEPGAKFYDAPDAGPDYGGGYGAARSGYPRY